MLFLLHSISSQASQQEAIRQKEILTNEVGSLRGELQQVREDRDLQVAQVQSLKAEIARFNDCAGKTTSELEKLTAQTNLLEVCTRYFSFSLFFFAWMRFSTGYIVYIILVFCRKLVLLRRRK